MVRWARYHLLRYRRYHFAATINYEAKCGAPTAGNPKVFFKYFYVNTATGEKSGEVLVQGKLD